MKTIAKLFKSISVFLMGIILFTSCMKDGLIEPGLEDGQAEISFSFTTPEPMKVQTRATIEEENYVATLHLLIFNSGKLVKTVTKTNAELSSSTTTISKDTWGLRTTLTVGQQYDFVTVANVSLPATTAVGMTKADFVAAINAQAFIDANLTETLKWVVSNAKPIPMWGEVSTVRNVVSTDIFTIRLKRLMARVNVSVAAAARANFELTQVRFYNYNTKGQLIPNHNGVDYEYPSIPAISGKQTTASPAFFGYNNIDGVTASACQNLIYVLENANVGKYSDGTAKKWQDNPSVVIGGKFDSGAETFYRLDFVKVELGSEIWLDVKRNHSYNFNITKVSGNGYAAPEDALMSAPINIDAVVTPWDDGAVAEVVEDGQYKMGVSEKIYSFSKEPSANNALSIYTTYTQTGLVVKYSDSETNADAGSAWLSQASLTNDGGSDLRIYDLKFDVAKNDGAPRTGYIHLLVGRMHMVVSVEQSNVVSSLLVIENASGVAIDAIEFSAASGVALGEQRYKVKWAPKSETLYIGLAPVANPEGGVYDPLKWVYYNTESGAINSPGTAIWTTPIANGAGEVEFTIKPSPITHGVDGVNLTTNPFYERSQQINFRATGSDGTMRKSVILQQMVRNMQPSAEGFYLADGSDYTFNVKSNRPWKAYLVDNGGGIVTSPTVNSTIPFATGGYNLPDGANVGFTTFNDLSNPTLFSGTAKVRIEWLSGDDAANSAHWTSSSIDLTCGSALIQPPSNSYIVAPGGAGILIPVFRANESMLGTQLGTNEAFTAELVWTDNANRIAANSNIRAIRALGSGAGGYVLVMPGSQPGNAVVAIKNSANTILWSWHIWVTGYNPAPIGTGKFMDRNLGAFSNTSTATVTDVSATGLLYQWGRKDPFPGSTTLNGIIEPTLYTTTGTTVVTNTLVAVDNNFGNSVANPATFYSAFVDDWYSRDYTIHNDALWSPASKTVYDPCPAGWRVPESGVWDGLTEANFVWGNYGRTAASHGGFYPATGYRTYTVGKLIDAGAIGTYWSATVSEVYARTKDFGSSYVSPPGAMYRAHGFSVRCVQE